ncbi:unnamed protein product [Brassica rapa subsp. trilocularis]
MKIGWVWPSATRVNPHGFTYPRRLIKKKQRRSNAERRTWEAIPARMKMELDDDIARGVVPARTENELRRRSNAGSKTRGVVPARTERQHRRPDAG